MPAANDPQLKILAVCHEPRGEPVPRTRLHNELQSSPGYCKYFQSVWLIATPETPVALWNRIVKSVPKQDFVLIIEVKNEFGYLPKDAWDWIASVRKSNHMQDKKTAQRD